MPVAWHTAVRSQLLQMSFWASVLAYPAPPSAEKSLAWKIISPSVTEHQNNLSQHKTALPRMSSATVPCAQIFLEFQL